MVENSIKEIGRIMTNSYYEYQKIRMASMNRMRDVIRKKLEGIAFDEVEVKKEGKDFKKRYTDETLFDKLLKIQTEGKISKDEYKYILKCWEMMGESKRLEMKYQKGMSKYISGEPIYTEFLTKIKGIGKVLSANLIKEFGDSIWDDLLKIAFKDIERNKYKGKKGFDNAVQALKDFEKSSGRKPISKDIGMKNIQNAICRGVWKEFGVNFWNDLFKISFGVENVRKSKYRGKVGLDNASQELREFKIQNKRNPTTKDPEMSAIYAAIYRGVWKEFEIHTWMDLFNYTFKRDD